MGKEGNYEDRLKMLFDDGTYTETERFVGTSGKGGESSVTAAWGYVGGSPVLAFSQTARALGSADLQKIRNVYDTALKIGAPVVGIYDADGVYVCEGPELLKSFGEVIAVSSRLSGVVPQISVVAGSCVGSFAVLASMADVIIMTKDAELNFSSPVMCADSSDDSRSGEFNGKTAAMVCDDVDAAVESAAKLLSMFPANNLSPLAVTEAGCAAAELTVSSDAYETVAAVCDADSFIELYKCKQRCAVTGIARIGGVPSGIVVIDGTPLRPAMSLKIARLVRLCDAFSLPVVTVLDCDGVEASSEFERNGGVKAVASLVHAYAEATVPKVTVIKNIAAGAALMAMAGGNADVVYAVEGAAVAALKPSAAVQLLYSERLAGGEDRKALEREYSENAGSARSAAQAGYIADVISAGDVRARVISSMEMLSSKRVRIPDKKHSIMPL